MPIRPNGVTDTSVPSLLKPLTTWHIAGGKKKKKPEKRCSARSDQYPNEANKNFPILTFSF